MQVETRPSSSFETKTGELRKRSAHLGVFRRRKVVLTSVAIQIFDLSAPDKILSCVPITADTTVSEITLETVWGNHGAPHPNQAVFQVKPNENVSHHAGYRPRMFGSSDDEHFFSASTLEEAKSWKEAIEERAKSLAERRAQVPPLGVVVEDEAEPVKKKRPVMQQEETHSPLIEKHSTEKLIKVRNFQQRMKKTASVRFPTPIVSTLNLINRASWVEAVVTNGVRIMAENALAKENPCLRVSYVLPASPRKVFNLLTNLERRCEWDSLTESYSVLKSSEDGLTRTVRFKTRAQTISGLRVAPRDYVVDTTWRSDSDHTYIILETGSNSACPPEKGYVRAEVFAMGMTICPRKSKSRASMDDVDEPDADESESEDCLLQFAVHACVGGWLAKLPISWSQAWLIKMMLNVIGIREALEQDNYTLVDFGSFQTSKAPKTKVETAKTPMSPKVKEEKGAEKQIVGTLPTHLAFDCPDPFQLRSATYMVDKKKETSTGAMFELLGMDLLEIDEPVENVAEELKKAFAYKYLASPDPKPFLFIIQFQIPGPPCMSFCAYFGAKKGVLEEPTPFSRLFSDFTSGTDSFRDGRFKLIPRVVKGNYMVKSAVGQTPALLGNKLVQSYHQGKGYFEIDVDVGSSSIAGSILRVIKGYLSSISMDLGFVLQGATPEELPEVVLGAFRFENLSLDLAKKYSEL